MSQKRKLIYKYLCDIIFYAYSEAEIENTGFWGWRPVFKTKYKYMYK
jgi:hypothetical protein